MKLRNWGFMTFGVCVFIILSLIITPFMIDVTIQAWTIHNNPPIMTTILTLAIPGVFLFFLPWNQRYEAFGSVKIGEDGVGDYVLWMQRHFISWDKVADAGFGTIRAGMENYYFVYFSTKPLTDEQRMNIGIMKRSNDFVKASVSILNRKKVQEEVMKHYKGDFKFLPGVQEN